MGLLPFAIRRSPVAPPFLKPPQDVVAPDAQDLVVADEGMQPTAVRFVPDEVDVHVQEVGEFFRGVVVIPEDVVRATVSPAVHGRSLHAARMAGRDFWPTRAADVAPENRRDRGTLLLA